MISLKKDPCDIMTLYSLIPYRTHISITQLLH